MEKRKKERRKEDDAFRGRRGKNGEKVAGILKEE